MRRFLATRYIWWQRWDYLFVTSFWLKFKEMSDSRSSSPSNGELASTLVELLRQQQKQSEAQQAILMGMLEQQKQNFEAHKAEVTSLLGRPLVNADRKTKVPPPLLQKLQPSDDIEQFLAVFECVARQQEWPNETWSTQLAALLTGKARDAYIALPFEDTKDFDNVKIAILKRYEINEETHRRKFRATGSAITKRTENLWIA